MTALFFSVKREKKKKIEKLRKQ